MFFSLSHHETDAAAAQQLIEKDVDGVIDRDRLLYVTEREIQAGRLTETDEIHRYALGDEHAFDAFFTTH